MSDSSRIGLGVCPVCASPKAHYTLSKKGLVCVTCNACNFQGFARSERSDEILRAKIKPTSEPSVVDLVNDLRQGGMSTSSRVHDDDPPPQPTPPPRRRSLLQW